MVLITMEKTKVFYDKSTTSVLTSVSRRPSSVTVRPSDLDDNILPYDEDARATRREGMI